MSSTNLTSSYRLAVDQIRLDVIRAMALNAALQLDLFTSLAEGPLTAEELSTALGVKTRRLKILLCQLVVSEFLEFHDTRFSNAPISAELFVKGRPDYYGGIHGLWTDMFTAMLKTADSITADEPKAKIDFEKMSQGELETFLKGIHGMAEAAGRSLAEKSLFTQVSNIVDVGGGSGGVAIGLCKEHQHLHATVIDLPSVVPIAEDMADQAGVSDRVTGLVGDIIAEPISGKYDVATARALFQVLSEEQCQVAAHNIAAALPSGGLLFIIGHITDDNGLAPEVTVGMNVFFLNVFEYGQAYRESEYRTWLENAGFTDIVRSPFVAGNSLISAKKL